MKIGGYDNITDWPKIGPSLLIATCLIVAIRTANWSTSHDPATSNIELEKEIAPCSLPLHNLSMRDLLPVLVNLPTEIG